MKQRLLRKTLLVVALIILLAAGLELFMGRTLFYAHGPIRLWSGNVWSDQNSQQLADPYTFTHITHGVLLYFLVWLIARRLPLKARFVIVIALEAAWEVFENTSFVINRYRTATLSLDYYGDSVLNSVGDMLAAGIGFGLAAKLPTYATVMGVIILEIVLALWIRDGLLLNMVMLTYPVPAIKTWQLQN